MESSQLMNLSDVEEESSTLLVQQQHEENENEDDKIRPWVDLPSELLNLIFSGLYDPAHISFSSIRDQIRFRLTCKTWQSVDCLLGQFPFLMSQNHKCSAFIFFNPITYKEIQVFDDDYDEEELFPDIKRCIHCSRFGGWLLMSRGICSLFFYNPFIPRSIIKLPLFVIRHLGSIILHLGSVTFTAPPTSKDCIVYVHGQYDPGKKEVVVIHRWCYGEDSWTTYHIDCQLPFGPSSGNPVFCISAFYQLSKHGRLGVLDLRKGNEQHMWKDLLRPKLLYPRKRRKRKWNQQQPKAQEDDISTIIQSKPLIKISTTHYMAECDGQLVMVQVEYKDGFHVQSVNVFELDWSRMEWVTVQSLGNKAMFISECGSLLIKTNGGGVENKIYFPDFVNTKYVPGFVNTKDAPKKVGGFYCLETHNYNFPPLHWKRVFYCTWIDTKFQL